MYCGFTKCPLPLASWSPLIKGALTDGWNLTSLLTVSLSSTECKVGGPWSSTAGLFSELDVWWGETCGNYWADALNEVSAGFPAGFKNSALGQEYRSHWVILWRHILLCCHSSYNHLTERVPWGAGRVHLFFHLWEPRCFLPQCGESQPPELFKRRSLISVRRYNNSYCLSSDRVAALD